MPKRFSVLVCTVALALLAACHNNNNQSGYGIGWVTLTENSSSAPATIDGVAGSADFSSYLVVVEDITLVGKTVGTVTAISVPEYVDFTKIKDISELWASASIPTDTYVSATITLDYSLSDYPYENVSVLINGVPTKATVIDPSTGVAATTVSAIVTFDPANQPIIVPTYASTNAIRMAVDFDVPASNTVSIVAGVPTVSLTPYFTFSNGASDSKLIRVRGPLVNSSLGQKTFSVYVRPFYDEVNSLGSLTLFNSESTIYSLNGTQYVGSDGLLALSQTSAGSTMTAAYTTFTPTVAQFTYAGIFNTVYIVAGSTLQDFYTDGLEGDVIARSGNTLTLRGTTLLANSAEVVQFNEPDATVLLGANTLVTVDGLAGLTGLSAASIAVGQHITARGLASQSSAVGAVTLDATGNSATNTGSVRIQPTSLYGSLVSQTTGGLLLNLQSIDDYPASVFNFAGNGATAAQDSIAAAYSVSTAAVVVPTSVATGDPLFINGYTSAFGAAPPDFTAATVNPMAASVDPYPALDPMANAINTEATAPATMIVTWTAAGTAAPFAPINATGLSIDITNAAFVSGVIRIGSESIDITTLGASPQVVPLVGLAPGTGVPSLLLPIFGVGSTVGGISVFNTYTDFVAKANALLATATSATLPTPAVKFVAQGLFNRGSNTFTASSINLVL